MREPVLDPNTVFNLSEVRVLLVDHNPLSLSVMIQIMMGAGVRRLQERGSLEEAQQVLKTTPIDLVVVSCELPDPGAYELVRWLRRAGVGENAQTSVFMVSGHAKADKVVKARDCGANLIIAQPFSPAALLQRILWLSRDNRTFVQTPDFAGPDRRFRDVEPNGGVERRLNWRKPVDVSVQQGGA